MKYLNTVVGNNPQKIKPRTLLTVYSSLQRWGVKRITFGRLYSSSQQSHRVCQYLVSERHINPLRPNSDPSQTSHCNIKGLSVSEVMRIENMITQVKFY